MSAVEQSLITSFELRRRHLSLLASITPDPYRAAALDRERGLCSLELAVLRAAGDFSSAVIVLLPEGDEEIEYKDGDTVPMHQTMAFLGPADEIDESQKQEIIEFLAEIAQRHQPIDASVAGHATLGDDQDDVALTESFGLQDMHDRINYTSDTIGQLALKEEHPTWISHVTGCDYDHGTNMTFDRLGYWHGNEKYEWPLGGGMMAAGVWNEDKHARDLGGKFAPKEEGQSPQQRNSNRATQTRIQQEAQRRAQYEAREETRRTRAEASRARAQAARDRAMARRQRDAQNRERRDQERAVVKQKHESERAQLAQKQRSEQDAREQARQAATDASARVTEIQALLRDAEQVGNKENTNRLVKELSAAKEAQKEKLREWVKASDPGLGDRQKQERDSLRDGQRAESDDLSARHAEETRVEQDQREQERAQDVAEREEQRAKDDEERATERAQAEEQRRLDWEARERDKAAREISAKKPGGKAKAAGKAKKGDHNHGRWVLKNGKYVHTYAGEPALDGAKKK